MVIPWISISVLVLLILLGVVAVVNYRRRGKKHEPDYYTFFIMGIIWTFFGIIFYKEMFFFLFMGIVLLILGWVNKDKWKKNHETWEQLDKPEKILKLIAIILLGILAAVGVIVYFVLKNGF